MNVNALFECDPDKPQAGTPVDPYKWLIIDGGGLVVMAWATHRDLETPEARVRAAIYVFITTLASLARMTDDRARVVVVWDGYDNRAYRRGYHPWYKFGRGSAIDRNEVRVVMAQLNELLRAIGVCQSVVDGREADDLVATIAREVDDMLGESVLIFSDDKDFYQLIRPNVHLCRRSLKGVILSPEQCDLGGLIYGEQCLEIKALMGDSGDNIRGIHGVGEKKAMAIMECIPDFYDLDDIGIDLIDWDMVGKATRNAMIRGGRKLVWPPKPKHKNDLAWARAWAAERGLPAPWDYSVDDDVCLKAAVLEAHHWMSLVVMDDQMDHPKLDFPEVNIEAIPGILNRLDMSREQDLLSSIYNLAKMRNPNAVPPRTQVERMGAAFNDDSDAPVSEVF